MAKRGSDFAAMMRTWPTEAESDVKMTAVTTPKNTLGLPSVQPREVVLVRSKTPMASKQSAARRVLVLLERKKTEGGLRMGK